ncbi:hypothetical protein AYX19_13735 [Paenarthrobacter ureafaciens]|nr:hypothetical protein AYX19_13735 [Paenarthrobacter ureafaciens]
MSRFLIQGRSSRPESCPHATQANIIAEVLTQRAEHREGTMDLAVRCGTSPLRSPGPLKTVDDRIFYPYE